MHKLNSNIVAIIPARGGSRGIPRKNVRLLAGKPLIAYVINIAKSSKYIKRVVVTTEDEEIAEVAKRFGAEVLMRPLELAQDEVPLDPVVFDAVRRLEKEGYFIDIVVTLQPTSPLLKVKTLNEAIERLVNTGVETVLSVVDDTHLFWSNGGEEGFVPLFKKRENRQYLPKMYKETGGIVVSRRDILTQDNRIGKKVDLIVLDNSEGIDIDTDMDWWLAEKLLARKRILFRVDGSKEVGLGHIYRSIALANRLIDHEVIFLMNARHRLGIRLVRQNNYNPLEFQGDPIASIEALHPDIVVNDILDTKSDYIKALKECGFFVVNFEDLGSGAKYADVVINALYERELPLPNHYWGAKYVCLREEFYSAGLNSIRPDVKNVLITFGGVDENNLTCKVLEAIDKIEDNVSLVVILGLGYSHFDDLNRTVGRMRKPCRIRRNVKSISKYIQRADLVITSAGRTVYEIASIGTPCVVLAQNQRELSHLYCNYENGFVNLGLGLEVSKEEIKTAISRLIESYELRKELQGRMLRIDLKEGINRVLDLIFKRFKERGSNGGKNIYRR